MKFTGHKSARGKLRNYSQFSHLHRPFNKTSGAHQRTIRTATPNFTTSTFISDKRARSFQIGAQETSWLYRERPRIEVCNAKLSSHNPSLLVRPLPGSGPILGAGSAEAGRRRMDETVPRFRKELQ